MHFQIAILFFGSKPIRLASFQCIAPNSAEPSTPLCAPKCAWSHRKIIKHGLIKLELVAETLLQKEKLTGEMFAQLMENGKLDEPEAQPTEEPEAPAAETQTAADTAPVPAPEGGDAPAAEAENAPADPAPEAPKSDR